MNLPPILSAEVLRKLAPAGETHAMRLILMSSSAATNFTLRGNGRRKGKYVLSRDGVTGRHTLDIPASLWNQDLPTGRYQDNASIAHDLMGKPHPLTPFVVSLVPWGTGSVTAKPSFAVAEAPAALIDAVETISLRLLEKMFPEEFGVFSTPAIHTALQRWCAPTINDFLKAAGRTATVEFIEAITAEAPADTKTETSAARRMREKRARDKAAREAAKLQTA